MTNQEIILTEKEIKEIISSLNLNPDKTEIEVVVDYFWLRPYALKHLEDKEFRKSFVRLIYMHKNAMNWGVKADKEVKRLQMLTTSLEKERNELLEKIKDLEARVEEKDNIIENLEERVDIEVETNLEALEISKKWHDKRVFAENMKRDATIIEQRIENDQLKKKLDAYEKKAKIKQIKNLTKRAKTKVNGKVQKLKEKVNAIKENFQTYILQEFESHILRQQ